MRTILPSMRGLKPRLATWMAFSMALASPVSQGWIWISRASGVVIAAQSRRRIWEP